MGVGTGTVILLWIALWLFFKYGQPCEIEIPPLVIIPALGAALVAYIAGHCIGKAREEKKFEIRSTKSETNSKSK